MTTTTTTTTTTFAAIAIHAHIDNVGPSLCCCKQCDELPLCWCGIFNIERRRWCWWCAVCKMRTIVHSLTHSLSFRTYIHPFVCGWVCVVCAVHVCERACVCLRVLNESGCMSVWVFVRWNRCWESVGEMSWANKMKKKKEKETWRFTANWILSKSHGCEWHFNCFEWNSRYWKKCECQRKRKQKQGDIHSVNLFSYAGSSGSNFPGNLRGRNYNCQK